MSTTPTVFGWRHSWLVLIGLLVLLAGVQYWLLAARFSSMDVDVPGVTWLMMLGIFATGFLVATGLAWLVALIKSVIGGSNQNPNFWVISQLYLLTSLLMAPSAIFNIIALSQGGEALVFPRLTFLPWPLSLFPPDKWVQLIVFGWLVARYTQTLSSVRRPVLA